ncbi:TIGR04283 family arsenosugar biosynthesis glycosyltransferase [Pricia sp. S334]|uniref:TIGR04283 family arsenosugar biosynthesis glycosyltransferase n=1 Tax=Pricia mediterranea TaxID=3076079 RepID=A0ABU3L5G4_9FLAO|nr:TIGR04283 family arsenosugar biosynthesis glycosyltransferase [Pricia sp. S334]MDT7828459.1 TIGR04283 family arsenosugar biosynthesis glycosyltransferase [Pricia sp. S334]
MTGQPPKISIIIPTLNEARRIVPLLAHVRDNGSPENILEILVIDGGSTDGTVAMASDFGAKVYSSGRGRARQMNFGAGRARGEILYFLHADTMPPKGFDRLIVEAVGNGDKVGCFRLQFDTPNRFLSFFAWFSRFNHPLCRGGDQSLYITGQLFDKTRGFNEDYVVYEDVEFIGRLYQNSKFKILPGQVVTSTRKYEQNGTIKLQYHFGVIHLKHFLGAGPKALYDYYKRNIIA